MRVTFLLLFVLLAASSCARHVQLSAPAPSAAESERIAAYERLRPSATQHTIALQNGVAVGHIVDGMVIADGQRVAHPGDIVPVVGTESPAGRAALRAESARRKKWVSAGVMMAGILGAFAVEFARFDGDKLAEPVVQPVRLVSLGISLVASAAYTWFAFDERGERAAAFATYEASLRDHLDLCVDQLRVVACASPAAATR